MIVLRAGNRASVGVALSSGGASSLAQIGVLEKLSEAGLAVDFVAGTSAGSIIGAVAASGQLAEFRAAVCGLTWRGVFRLFSLAWPRRAFLEFRSALEFVRPFVAEDFESLGKRFAAVAVDLASGDEVVIRSGSVIEAIRASCSIPGVFAPCRRDGCWLADGALVNPLPIDVARDLGASFAIAINVLAAGEMPADPPAGGGRATPRLRDWLAARLRRKPEAFALSQAVEDAADSAGGVERDCKFFAVVAQASRIVQSKIVSARLREHPADVLINVPVGDIGMFDFHRATQLVECGYRAAEKALPEIELALSAQSSASSRLRDWWRKRRDREALGVETPTPPDPSAIAAATP